MGNKKQTLLEAYYLSQHYTEDKKGYAEWDEFEEKNLAKEFDDNYYGEGSIELYHNSVDIESIWTDVDNKVMVHVDATEFEGDLLLRTLSRKNQGYVIEMLLARVDSEEPKGTTEEPKGTPEEPKAEESMSYEDKLDKAISILEANDENVYYLQDCYIEHHRELVDRSGRGIVGTEELASFVETAFIMKDGDCEDAIGFTFCNGTYRLSDIDLEYRETVLDAIINSQYYNTENK